MKYVLVIAMASIAMIRGPISNPAFSGDGNQVAQAVIHKGKLVHLDEKGRIRVWGVVDGKYDRETSSKLAKSGLRHLASDGDGLWAADETAVYAWAPAGHAWNRISDLEAKENETLQALVIFDRAPLLIFPTKVVSPTAARTFEVPQDKDRSSVGYLRVLDTITTQSMVWIGTGRGEWGGHLVGLNPRTEEWIHYQDKLHYVTSITREKPDELIVSWSMSHFSASTLIRIHKLDTSVKTNFPALEAKYYQRVAFSPFDNTLYGIEGTDLVTIVDGKPAKIAALDGEVFEDEAMAIGVSPGISGLIPIAEKTVMIVPNQGLPWRWENGELNRLSLPPE